MLRRLFNNKWFVVALGIGSMLLMGRSIFVEVWDASGSGEHVIEDPYAGLEFGDDFSDTVEGVVREAVTAWGAPQTARGPSVHHRRLAWNEQPRRDPFKNQTLPETAIPEQLTEAASQPAGPPRLQALVAGPVSSFVVFGDRVAGEGDRVGEYQIVSITPEGVRVDSPGGSSWLPPPGKQVYPR